MMQGLILLDFEIFENLYCIAANHEANVAVIKNRVFVILQS